MTSPIVALHTVELLPRPEHFRASNATTAARFDCSSARLGPQFGFSKLGCNITAVAPGKAAYPFHSHRANDELFLVLAGAGELRLGEQRHAVQQGDLIGCASGDASTAHQLINTGSVELRYLAVSSTVDPEVCEYPDSGKVGAYAGAFDKGLMHITRAGDRADYWDGE